jgi:hypothetical protein
MGLMQGLWTTLFGGGRNAVAEVVELFRVGAEAEAARGSTDKAAALAQFAAEFARSGQRSRFDRVVDGVNRLPRPALALGTLGLFVSAMVAPEWFAARMAGIALVPEPLWWLMGAVVSFYFGARHQAKGQEFQRGLALAAAAVGAGAGGPANTGGGAAPDAGARGPSTNPALDDWRAAR